MATLITHGLAPLAGGGLIRLLSGKKLPGDFWRAAIACGLVPDLDVLAFGFGIPYSSPWGHRGFSHSLTFALVFSFLVASLGFASEEEWRRRWPALWPFFFLTMVFHGLTDAMTDGGLGVGFFVPFSQTRYFLPWRPLVVSPIGVHGLFSRYGVEIMRSELLYVWLPILGLLIVAAVIHHFRRLSRRDLRENT